MSQLKRMVCDLKRLLASRIRRAGRGIENTMFGSEKLKAKRTVGRQAV